jgi:hypothetical protein
VVRVVRASPEQLQDVSRSHGRDVLVERELDVSFRRLKHHSLIEQLLRVRSKGEASDEREEHREAGRSAETHVVSSRARPGNGPGRGGDALMKPFVDDNWKFFCLFVFSIDLS